MFLIKLFVSCALLFVSCCRAESPEFDCQRPPRLVDPTFCCKDGGYEQTSTVCAERMGITGQSSNGPPTVEKATCFAECILKNLQYIQEPEKLNYEAMYTDMQTKYGNDSVYVQTMMEAFRKCEPAVQNKLQVFQRLTLLGSAGALRRGCSPFSGMLLGCTFMEYFKNCPAHRWTENDECALAKRFVIQCASGAIQI